MKRVALVLEKFDGLVKTDLKCAVGILSQFPETQQMSGRLRENGSKSWDHKHSEISFFEGWPSGRWINPIRAEFETALNNDTDLAYSVNKILDNIVY